MVSLSADQFVLASPRIIFNLHYAVYAISAHLSNRVDPNCGGYSCVVFITTVQGSSVAYIVEPVPEFGSPSIIPARNTRTRSDALKHTRRARSSASLFSCSSELEIFFPNPIAFLLYFLHLFAEWKFTFTIFERFPKIPEIKVFQI